MSKKHFHICEYGLVRKASDFVDKEPGDYPEQNETYLPDNAFNSFISFILENQSPEGEPDPPFTLFKRNRREQVKVRNYVGVVETKEGVSLEILPKIHFGEDKNALAKTKSLFLKMLRHLRNSPFKNISTAHLRTENNFPVLEVFISAFINECELLFQKSIRSDYIKEEENLNFVRGKILISQNTKHNHTNRARVYCEFEEFSQNTPQNKIIKTTLRKLVSLTKSHSNLTAINKLISILDSVDLSEDIGTDLRICGISIKANRLYSNYINLLQWSEIFLLGKSFTNFKGNSLNAAVLFPMERIFEDYVAGMFKRYGNCDVIKTQDRSFFLIEKHIDKQRIQLRPDIVVENENTERIIIDTKWKLIDENRLSGNYNISLTDMYQLFAYGSKYKTGDKVHFPKLVLLYPVNSDFTQRLDPFYYYDDPTSGCRLELNVIPFDLEATDIEGEVQKVLI